MLIGVISDTHDKLATIDSALDYFRDHGVEKVLHIGDWKLVGTVRYFADQAAKLSLPVSGVLGNNDAEIIDMLSQVESLPGDFTLEEGVISIDIDGKSIALYHGHHKPTLTRLLKDATFDIICLGHSHKPRIENINGTLIVNPGSTAFSIPRSRQWRPSVAVIDTSRTTARIHYLNP